MAVEEGNMAPSFTLKGDDGKTHRLRDLRGKRAVLYFYLRDNRPGSTTEACDFRDNLARLSGASAVVLEKQYRKVREGVIRSTLLIDESGKIARRWRNVRAKGHVSRVLEALEALG